MKYPPALLLMVSGSLAQKSWGHGWSAFWLSSTKSRGTEPQDNLSPRDFPQNLVWKNKKLA